MIQAPRLQFKLTDQQQLSLCVGVTVTVKVTVALPGRDHGGASGSSTSPRPGPAGLSLVRKKVLDLPLATDPYSPDRRVTVTGSVLFQRVYCEPE